MKNRKRYSPIWLMPLDEFKDIVRTSSYLSQILKHFDLVNSHGNYNTLKARLEEDHIDYSHIKMGMDSNKGRQFLNKIAFPLEQIMVENSTYSRGKLKKRLIENKMLNNVCSICGLLPQWNGKDLVLILDHINGINNDNRLSNLRLICPNCNSQTSTFSGRQNKKRYHCENCGRERRTKKGKLCQKCNNSVLRVVQRKVKDRPLKEQLLKEIKETSFCAVGRKYGVSDNAIRKWLRSPSI